MTTRATTGSASAPSDAVDNGRAHRVVLLERDEIDDLHRRQSSGAHSSPLRWDVLQRIFVSIAEVRRTTSESIDALLQRGTRLDRLVERSHTLASESQRFEQRVRWFTGERWRITGQCLARLFTCNYVCVDLYMIFSDYTEDFGSLAESIREEQEYGRSVEREWSTSNVVVDDDDDKLHLSLSMHEEN